MPGQGHHKAQALVDRYIREGISEAAIWEDAPVPSLSGKVLVRRMNDPKVALFEKIWASQLQQSGGVSSDQLLIPYALWRSNVRFRDLGKVKLARPAEPPAPAPVAAPAPAACGAASSPKESNEPRSCSCSCSWCCP